MKSNEELIAKITIHFLRPFRNRKEVHDALREVPFCQSDPHLSRLNPGYTFIFPPLLRRVVSLSAKSPSRS